MNLDPNFYTHLNEKSRKEDMETGDAENFVSEERVDQMYTDEMEATDLFDLHEGEEEELDDFLATNPGNIFEEDTNAEMLYKMNEHLSHIIIPITEFVNNEEMMKHII